jgi:hypothetical protein
VVFSAWLSHRDVLSFGGEIGLKEKLHEAQHRSRMRASLMALAVPNKESRNRRRAERKYFVEHRREPGFWIDEAAKTVVLADGPPYAQQNPSFFCPPHPNSDFRLAPGKFQRNLKI